MAKESNMKHVTLLFLLKPETQEICLAMKKRGFGVGKLNGVGGKIEEGETVPQAAVREAKEEVGVDIDEEDIEHVGTIAFSFDLKPDWGILCTVFLTILWEGEPVETEEMAPQWFSLHNIPYEHMWIDDVHWLPQVLEGNILQASFLFNNDGTEVLDKKILTVGRQQKLIAYANQN